MKKLLLATAATLLFSTQANAGVFSWLVAGFRRRRIGLARLFAEQRSR